MRIINLVIPTLGMLALVGCTSESNSAEPRPADPAKAFENLEVAEGFTFAMRRDVSLTLRAEQPDVAKYIEVSDDEGRRLFAGAVLGNMDLDFDVRSGSQPQLNVRIGKGADAVLKTVDLENGRGTTSY